MDAGKIEEVGFMLKKFLLIIMSALCVALAGCGGGGEDEAAFSRPQILGWHTEMRRAILGAQLEAKITDRHDSFSEAACPALFVP